MAPVGPWAQPKATRREGGRRAERPVGSYATPDTPCSRTAPKGLPQAETWAERERVPSGHNCRRQLATGRPEQIQEPGTAVPGTPIFANNAKRGGPPLESPCRQLSLVLSFASKESTAPSGRQPHQPRRSRRVRPLRDRGMRLRAHQRAFRSPVGNLRAPKLAGNSWVCKPDFCTLRRRVMLHRGKTGLDHPLS